MTGLLLAALTACGGGGPVVERPPSAPSSPSEASVAPAVPTEPTQPAVPEQTPVERALSRMSVEEKVGQLFMPVIYGTTADSASEENQARYGARTPAEVIEKYHLGGVILFPYNVKSVSQVVGFTNGLQRASKVPLLIATDQENGLVSRFAAVMSTFPGAGEIGKTGKPELAQQVAEATGKELRALGVNLDFAPVADVNVNPRNPVIGTRAYGDDPTLVAKMVAAAVKGFDAAKMAATAKHFPGHGDTTVDSHTGLPVIGHTKAEWERIDAPPFKAAIKAGVDAVMSAHIVFPKLDRSGDPATLSKTILTGLLRDELGFTGVISTDALNMAGVRKKYDDGEIAVRAVLAGADLLLMPNDLQKAQRAVLAAVKSGRITKERLDQSVTRLLTLKDHRGLLAKTPVASAAKASSVMRLPEHRKLAALFR
ncbi:beta-N-acetylhexosaminidase [Nonomuraea maritima]|uniref:beta-N-acetylhexosaminidase n=1 Tax=Nonomuraea maritima TaxID=683260 RepID=UPI0037104395